MKHVISVVTFESRIDDQARAKPEFTDMSTERPERSSSLIRSKIRMFASTAIPTLSMNPPIQARVKVTGKSLKIARVINV